MSGDTKNYVTEEEYNNIHDYTDRELVELIDRLWAEVEELRLIVRKQLY